MWPGSSSTLGGPKNWSLDGSASSRLTGLQLVAALASLQKLSLVQLCSQTTYAVPDVSTATAGGTVGALPTVTGVPVLVPLDGAAAPVGKKGPAALG